METRPLFAPKRAVRPRFLHTYTYNNPTNYIDPSGHVVECPDLDGCGNGPPPDPTPAPVVVGISPGVQIILMPPNSVPEPVNGVASDIFGFLNAVTDLAEAGISFSGLIGNPVSQGIQIGVSGIDVGWAALSSIFAGETGVFSLHPDLPEMLVIGQDVLITGTEAIVGAAAPPAGGLIGGYFGGKEGAAVGYETGLVLDVTSSLASAAYDVARTQDAIPTGFAIGLYRDSSAPTRIPLPGFPQGQLIVAVIIYQ